MSTWLAAIPGMALQANAALGLSDGDLVSGAMHGLAGAAVLDVQSMGEDHRTMSGSVLLAGLCACSEAALKRDFRRLAVAGAVTVLPLVVPTKVMAVATRALTLAGASGLVAYSGAKDIAQGERLRGIGKIATGVLGVAVSGYYAYEMLTDPEQMGFDSDYLVWPREPRISVVSLINDKDKLGVYVRKYGLTQGYYTSERMPREGELRIVDYSFCTEPRPEGRWVLLVSDEGIPTDVDPNRLLQSFWARGRKFNLIMDDRDDDRLGTHCTLIRLSDAGCALVKKILETRACGLAPCKEWLEPVNEIGNYTAFRIKRSIP